MNQVLRQSNIELLRIFLMLMIIFHHVIFHGLNIYQLDVNTNNIKSTSYIYLFFECFIIVAVNVFVFISGYFGIKFKPKTLLLLFLQTFFYSTTIYLFFVSINIVSFSFKELLLSFFPVLTSLYWFVSIYIGLYIISPFLNVSIDSIENDKIIKIALLLLIILDTVSGFVFGNYSGIGYSVFHFIVIYLIARYMRLKNLEIKNANYGYIFCSLILFIVCILLIWYGYPNKLLILFKYNNPILVVSSVFLFYSFKNLKVKNNKTINLMAAQVLGVYMVHDNPNVRIQLKGFVNYIYLDFEYNTITLFFILIFVVILVFIFSSFIEIIRKKIIDEILLKYVNLMIKYLFHRNKCIQ